MPSVPFVLRDCSARPCRGTGTSSGQGALKPHRVLPNFERPSAHAHVRSGEDREGRRPRLVGAKKAAAGGPEVLPAKLAPCLHQDAAVDFPCMGDPWSSAAKVRQAQRMRTFCMDLPCCLLWLASFYKRTEPQRPPREAGNGIHQHHKQTAAIPNQASELCTAPLLVTLLLRP